MIVSIQDAVEIAKLFFKNIEDEITPYFYKMYEKYHLPICCNSNYSNSDQLVITNSLNSTIKYSFPQSTYEEVRLKFHLNQNLDQIIFTVNDYNNSREVGSFKVNNPLMKYFIEKCWNKDERGYISTKTELRKAIQESKTWNSFCDQKTMSDPLSILLDSALNKTKFDYEGMILFGLSGCGTYSYKKEKQTWDRVYGKPFVKILDNVPTIKIGH